MKKIEVMCILLHEISEITEIESNAILSSEKSEDVVDARHLLIKLLHEKGLYSGAIAQLIGCTKRNINGVICNFNARCASRKLLRSNYELLRNRVRDKEL